MNTAHKKSCPSSTHQEIPFSHRRKDVFCSLGVEGHQNSHFASHQRSKSEPGGEDN